MDPSFLITRILTELIFPGLKNKISKEGFRLSYSPIHYEAAPAGEFAFIIERLREEIEIRINITEPGEQRREIVKPFLESCIRETPFVLQMITRREIKGVHCSEKANVRNHKNEAFRYTLSLRKETVEINITVSLEPRFFNILIPSINTSEIRDTLSEALIPFFRKPDLLIPSIEMLLEKSDSYSIAEMIGMLKKKKLLTDYQLVLLMNAFPQHALKLKGALSKNSCENLKREMERYRGKISKEDMACGIYSVEESLGRVLIEEKFNIAEHFRTLSEFVKKISDYDLYSLKSWGEWLSEMEKKNLLQKALLKCSDRTIADAFSDYSDERYDFMKKYYSSGRLQEIFAQLAGSPPYSVLDARISLIKKYREASAESVRVSHESFPYILASVKQEKDYEIIIRNTGWFLLSTSLKQCGKKLQDRVLKGINYAASILIKGVLEGTINPDILHDEIQVNRARGETLVKILQLYNDGLIELDF